MPSSRLLAALALAAAPLAAQRDEYPVVHFEGRLQQQFYWLDNAGRGLGPRNGFFTRRARIEGNARLSERLSAVIEPSYEGGRVEGLSLKDAYIDVLVTEPRTDPPLTLRIGQSKRPFGRYETFSSKNLPSIERGAGMGLVPIATNDLFDAHELVGRDIGVTLIAKAGKRILLEAGIYNGEGESAPRDVNDAKTVAGRLGLTPAGRLTIGVSAISHEGLPDSLGPTVRHVGWGVDLGWGEPGGNGLFLLAELMSAESFEAAPRRIRGGLLVAAWNIPVERRAIHSVEPVVRLDLADPDDAVSDDESTLLSAGLGLYFTPTAQFRLLAERQGFADGRDPIAGIRGALTVYF